MMISNSNRALELDTAWGKDSGEQRKPVQQESSGIGGSEVPVGSSVHFSRRQSASTAEEDPWATAEVTASLNDDRGSSTKASAKSSGKDFIPEYAGSGPIREYQRRVKLFELSTGIDPTFRAQKLMEKLTGNAWLAAESLQLESLKRPDGVSRLLDHLWRELELLEFVRTFQTLADFYESFRRSTGQEFVNYDMEYIVMKKHMALSRAVAETRTASGASLPPRCTPRPRKSRAVGEDGDDDDGDLEKRNFKSS
ncbi:unnamed protein product [Symbiodinium sp. CCMP2592]|nr:unnamed protein product [Symbiodinium sp. CCMP2592]